MPLSSATSGSITLDDLIAMNDEIASCMRAGIPLELGLGQLAVNAPQGLADLSGRLAQRLGNGQSLSEALDAEAASLPRVYRAVIAAGMRAGRLSAAMETVAELSRTMQELRRRITLSLIYPGLVILTAYYLFWFFVGQMFPVAMELTLKPHEAPTGWLATMWSVHRAVVAAGHIPPAIVGVLIAWWVIAGRYLSPAGGMSGTGLRWLPGIRGSLRRFHLASFSELSAVLLEHDVPPAEALQLAAESTGDSAIIRDATALATACRRGDALSTAVPQAAVLPGFMQWMIAAGEREGGLAAAFRQLAAIYRKRALAGADRFKLWFPIVVTVTLGGLVATAYTLSLFVPLTEMLEALSRP
jgi:type II secretory pathway component PulF